MHRAGLLLLVTAGCRQVLGIGDPVEAAHQDGAATDASTIDAPQVPTDASGDGGPHPSCMQRWQTTPVFGMPARLAELDTSDDEDHPFLLADEKTIYFARKDEVLVATRTSPAGAFGPAQAVPGLSTSGTPGRAFISADETRAFFASDRSGGVGGFDLWRGARNSTNGTFSVDAAFLGNVNTANAQVDPHLSADLLHLYLSSTIGNVQRIVFATRGSIQQSFGPPQAIAELVGGVAAGDTGPTLTPDETVIVFASTRGSSASHLYYATRATGTTKFSTPAPLPDLASTAAEGSPHLSADGCHVYFMSTRNGSRDLFVAAMQ